MFPDFKEVNGRCLPHCAHAITLSFGERGVGPDGIHGTEDDLGFSSNIPCNTRSDYGYNWVDVDLPGTYLGIGDHWDKAWGINCCKRTN